MCGPDPIEIPWKKKCFSLVYNPHYETKKTCNEAAFHRREELCVAAVTHGDLDHFEIPVEHNEE